ncbi:MAG: anti-sigma factor domain-containing protein [Firmicutes bacterium]|nr:anti-sigma factor domain-containing protein [Bacillota bacterium]
MRGVECESGIVLEARGRTVILLTRNGEFRRATVAGRVPDIGEEIAIPSRNATFALHSIFEWPAFRAAAVAALVLIVFILAGVPGYNLPVWLKFRGAWRTPPAPGIAVYVSVDINPSIELALDASTVVIQARSFNEDGEKLLGRARVVGKKATEAIEVLTDRAIDDNFIGGREPGGIILLAVTPQGAPGAAPGSRGSKADLNPEVLGEELRRAAGLVLARRGVQVASIETLTVDRASRDEAVRKGLSAGRLALVTRAREAGIRIGIEDVRRGRIGDVMAHAGVNLHDLLAASDSAPGMIRDGGGPGWDGKEPAGPAEPHPRPPVVAIFMKTGSDGTPRNKGVANGPSTGAAKVNGTAAGHPASAGVGNGVKAQPESPESKSEPSGIAGLRLSGSGDEPGMGPGAGQGQGESGDSNAHGGPVMLASASDVSVTKGAGIATAPNSNSNPDSSGVKTKGLRVSGLSLSKEARVSQGGAATDIAGDIAVDKDNDKYNDKNDKYIEGKSIENNGQDKGEAKDKDKDKGENKNKDSMDKNTGDTGEGDKDKVKSD